MYKQLSNALVRGCSVRQTTSWWGQLSPPERDNYLSYELEFRGGLSRKVKAPGPYTSDHTRFFISLFSSEMGLVLSRMCSRNSDHHVHIFQLTALPSTMALKNLGIRVVYSPCIMGANWIPSTKGNHFCLVHSSEYSRYPHGPSPKSAPKSFPKG
jgi:hypothetical protein